MAPERKNIVLRWAWNICAAIALVFVVVPQIDSVSARFTAHDVFYGDMYSLNKVEAFKLPVPKVDTPKGTPLKKAKVVTIGDSFFGSHFEQPRFWYLLEKRTGVPTFHVDDIHANISPTAALSGLDPRNAKLAIWEEVERNIVDVFAQTKPIGIYDLVALLPFSLRSGNAFHAYEAVRNRIFDTKPMLFFIENSRLTAWFFETLYSLRFALVGDISPRTPEYSADPAMVFFDAELEKARVPLDDADIMAMADRIEQEIVTMRDSYGIETVYVPLPSKYTVYRELLADQSYNQLLPRLVLELQARNVMVLDVLPVFEAYEATHDELLYYPSDTHWRPEAVQIVMDLLIEELKSEPELAESIGL